MMRRRGDPVRTALLLLLIGCSSETQMTTPVTRPPLGDAITTTTNAWTWVDFPDSSCDDGSATGIGVNQGTSSNLIVFLNGGGACWDYLTCFRLNTASHGPFGKTEFDGMANDIAAGTIFDRDDDANPFKDWSYVFVPYC